MDVSKKAWGAVALAGLSIAVAEAATVSCPASSLETLRQVEVTGAQVSGYCAYQSGNFIADDFSGYFEDGYTLLDKDVAGTGETEAPLLYTMDPGGGFGTWALASDLWSTWSHVYLALHFGQGRGDPGKGGSDPGKGGSGPGKGGSEPGKGGSEPGNSSGGSDSFIVELESGVLEGTWALLPADLVNALSNIYLIASNAAQPPCTVDCGGGEAPEPGSLAMLLIGLTGLALIRRRPTPA